MSGETITTIVGQLTDDPVLRHTPAGAVTTFTVASTPRFRDDQTGEWRDGENLFLRTSVWRTAAEYAAATLHRGARVIVTGRLRQRSFETASGEKRTVIELDADEVGASLKFTGARIVELAKAGPTSAATPA